MTLDQYIEALEVIRAEHGGEVEVLRETYDGRLGDWLINEDPTPVVAHLYERGNEWSYWDAHWNKPEDKGRKVVAV
jgi:hypothetical protein